MKKITVGQIKNVLEQTLNEYKSGNKAFTNIIFVGETGIGKNSIIKQWLQSHSAELKPYQSAPGVIMKEEHGVLMKDFKNGKVQYGFADLDMEALSRNGTVYLCERLNYKTDEQLQPLKSIFADRKYETITGNIYDLSKLFLTVSTAYPNSGRSNVADITDLEQCSDVYYVEVNVQEFREYFNQAYQNDAQSSIFEAFNKILSSKKFHFIFDNDESFGPRTVETMYSMAYSCESMSEFLEELECPSNYYGAGTSAKQMIKEICEEEKIK